MKVPLYNKAAGQVAALPRKQEGGVALIVTLILLSVITFMAVTFLVVSRGQKSSVGTTTDMAIAREAANAAVERVKAEIVATMMANTNAGNIDLLVSTNFINRSGFIPGLRSFTNVSYAKQDGTLLTRIDDQLENLSHLLYNPRPPVFITNTFFVNSNDFRYYLDLNRNGRYDANGFEAVINPNGGFYDTNYAFLGQAQPGVTLSNFFVGDPEWIGRLERADLPHSATNKFVYRYAYVAVPSGKTLDLNSIFNDALSADGAPMTNTSSQFVRNQGIGTWEVNLAAFLTDLNTNFWPSPSQSANAFGTPYFYSYTPFGVTAQGSAFDDAKGLLNYRYQYSKLNLASAYYLFGATNVFLTSDMLDSYCYGPVVVSTAPSFTLDPDKPARPWSGADNPVNFFTTQELFDGSKTAKNSPGMRFSDRLRLAGAQRDSYDRYTFYRLLSQLGTDTSFEGPEKINLNYDNQVQANTATRTISSTNFIPWEPTNFFLITANRLLANAGYNTNYMNLGSIQIYPTNFYTPHVHQMLQLAANIYDATTPRRQLVGNLMLPTVFRPVFSNYNNMVFIKGYAEVTNALQVLNVATWHDLAARGTNTTAVFPYDMVYGVPLVVGARKGFPNFNELGMQTSLQVSRKLEFRRNTPGGPIVQTNVMYTMSISNLVGVEAWNSYSNTYPQGVELRLGLDMFATLTNHLGEVLAGSPTVPVIRPALANYPSNTWQGYYNPNYAQDSFRTPLAANSNHFAFLVNSVYSQSQRRFIPIQVQNPPFERVPPALAFAPPHWFLDLRTRMRFALVDTASRGLIDYVNLDAIDEPLDLAAILAMDGNCQQITVRGPVDEGSMWCTNQIGGADSPTIGMQNQIAASLGMADPPRWNTDQQESKERAIDFFRAQFRLSPITYQGSEFATTNVFYSPYVATRTVYYKTELQANDPLVHYTLGDLRDFYDNFQTNRITFTAQMATNNIGLINKRFEPWGGSGLSQSASPTLLNLAVKDPMVRRSDDWDFPTNKFPNVGWLGRVHRGTPWQTINLKGDPTNVMLHPLTYRAPAPMRTWAQWCGNGVLDRNVGQYDTNVVPFNFITNDASFTHPINDRYIIDLFTTALNENATKGQLSVNQTNLAAWSAVLSALNVMPNANSNMFIQPAGIYDPRSPTPVARIVAGIQRTLTNYPGGMFHRLGDVLATPELTVASPFLKSNARPGNWLAAPDMPDSVYERIPQQVLGLLKGPEETRFVVYAYGQALKPADRSLYNGAGPYFGICTNYQVTAEAATRTVLRVEGTPRYPSPLSAQKPFNNLRVVVESFNLLPPD